MVIIIGKFPTTGYGEYGLSVNECGFYLQFFFTYIEITRLQLISTIGLVLNETFLVIIS